MANESLSEIREMLKSIMRTLKVIKVSLERVEDSLGIEKESKSSSDTPYVEEGNVAIMKEGYSASLEEL